MKKLYYLLGSIVLFLISLFFLIGVLVLGDFDAIIIFGIPLLLFGVLFYFTFKKYLKVINFSVKNFYEKWRNSKSLRIFNLVLSCLSYIFVVVGLSSPNSLLVISIISTLLFGGLYIIKPLLGNKIDYSVFKSKKLLLVINFILVILITVLSNCYIEMPANWEMGKIGLEILDSFDSGIEKIVFGLIYVIYRDIMRDGLATLIAILTYLSFILCIDNCFRNTKNNQEWIRIFGIVSLCLFTLNFIIHINNVIGNMALILLNILVFAMLINNNIINKDRKTIMNDVRIYE